MSDQVITVPWHKRAAVWLGVAINPASITLGGGLAALLPWRPLLLVITFGVTLISLLCVAQGLASRRGRATLALLASRSFGQRLGAPLLNLMMSFGMIGWGGFHVGVSGAGAASLLAMAGSPWPAWTGTLLVISAFFILSLLGVSRWNALLWITTGAALALALFAVIAVDGTLQVSDVTEAVSLRDYLWAAGTVIAYAILFALRSADFACDLNSDRDVYNVVGLFAGCLLVAMLIGALLFWLTGDWNLAAILAEARFAALGQLFLIVSVTSPALSSLHSGRLALSGLTGLPERMSLVIMSAIIFLLAATRFDLQLIPFLDLVSALLPPALLVMLARPWLGRWHLPSELAQKVALGAWLLGAGVALVFKLQGQLVHMVAGGLVSLTLLLSAGWYLRAAEPAGSSDS